MKHFLLFYLLSCISLFAAEQNNQANDETGCKFAKEFILQEAKIYICITHFGQTRIYDQDKKNWYAVGQVPIDENISCVIVDNKDYRVLILSDKESYNFGFVTSKAMAGRLSTTEDSFTLAQNRAGNLFAILFDHTIVLFDERGIIDAKVCENVFNVSSIEFSATNEQVFVTQKTGNEHTVSQYGIVANRDVLTKLWKYNPVVLKCVNQTATLFAAVHQNNNLMLYDQNGQLIDKNLGHNIDIDTACYLEFSSDNQFVTVIYEDFDDEKSIFISSHHRILNPKLIEKLGNDVMLRAVNNSKTLIATIDSQGVLKLFDQHGQCLDGGERFIKPQYIGFDEKKKGINVIAQGHPFFFDITNCPW